MDKKLSLCLKTVVAILVVVFLCSLFIGVAKITYGSKVLSLTGANLLFGKTNADPDTVVIYSKIVPSWPTIVIYCLAALVLITSIVNIIKDCKYLNLFVVSGLMVISLFSWLKMDYVLTSTTHLGSSGQLPFGYVMSAIMILALLVEIGVMALQLEKEDIIKYLVIGLMITAFTTMPLKLIGAYMSFSEYKLAPTTYSGVSILFIEKSYSTQPIQPAYLYVAYASLIVGMGSIFIQTKQAKLPYLISALFVLVATVFFVLAPSQTFAIVQKYDYYYSLIAPGGLVAIIAAALGFIGSLYLAAITPNQK